MGGGPLSALPQGLPGNWPSKLVPQTLIQGLPGLPNSKTQNHTTTKLTFTQKQVTTQQACIHMQQTYTTTHSRHAYATYT